MGMLEDVRDLLKAGRVTVQYGAVPPVTASIYGGTMPNSPDRLVGLYDSTGFEPERTMGWLVAEVRNLQILARDVKSVDAESLAAQCFNIVDQYVGTLNGKGYKAILGRHVPFSIGVDENNRTTFTCNYIVTKER
jgi:hypothetical protein